MIKKIIKIIGIALFFLILIAFLAYLIAPTGPRDLMKFDDPYQTDRPSVKGKHFMVATGNPWTTKTAIAVMEKGGNAFDASAAALLVLNVTYGEAASFPGVAPLLIYSSDKKQVIGYCGAGTAPGRATIELFKKAGFNSIPDMDIRAQLIPASPDVLIELLQKYGTISFHECAQYAIDLAEKGFPTHRMMLNNLNLNIFERFGFSLVMPYNVKVYLKGEWWRPFHHKDRFTRPDLAKTFREMVHAEKEALAKGKSRDQALDAVRDYFYNGPIAKRIVDFHENENGLFTMKDLEKYQGYWEEPVRGRFGDFVIYSNNTWTQGPVVPLALQILNGIDLKSMGHNSPQYVHTVLQAIELAMADREAYFGDPRFVAVPLEKIMSSDFAEERRKAMTPGRAFGSMPASGNNRNGDNSSVRLLRNIAINNRTEVINKIKIRDTSYISVVDSKGNAVSMTPSDFPKSPMVPGTGLTLGIRMTQFRLNPEHPASLEPGKRPRITPNPGMVLKNGHLFMTFGTPGGDMQAQAMIQVFLNIVVFGMDPQEAINRPRFRSMNFPDSFSPHEYNPGVIVMEKSLFQEVGNRLEGMGYTVKTEDDWHYTLGAVCVVLKDPVSGMLIGAADPREESWAEGR